MYWKLKMTSNKNYKNISKNKDHYKKATGWDHKSFPNLFEFVNLSKDCKNFMTLPKGYVKLSFLYCQAQWIY